MSSKRFTPDTANLTELLGSSTQLRVPVYQRRFAWNHRQEVAQLWQDICEALERKAGEYFLGTVVLSKSQQDVLEIIDGQQRLATLSMILAALRNKLMSLGTADSGASSASNKLHEYILRTDLLGHPKGAALTLGKYDQDGFRRYVQLRPGEQSHLGVDANLPQIKPGRPPINRIKEAFKHIIELVDKYIADLPPEKQRDRLANLADYLLEKVTHITIEVTEDVDAFASLAAEGSQGFVLRVVDVHNLIEAAYSEYFPDRPGKGADGELGLLVSQRLGH